LKKHPIEKRFKMHKSILNAIAIERGSTNLDDKDVKSNEQHEATNMDYVNNYRDFSKITEKDLEAVFLKLRTRCYRTWTGEMEKRSKNLHRKFMTLKMGSTEMYIDPDRKFTEAKTNDLNVQRLMTDPKIWSMGTKENALEFSEILRHFTIFAPFEGRPFVRAWLEALTPIFSRWILLSEDRKVSKTLKNFLGAFGQPGIVVCLPDKGTAMLEILKQSARSVEALGRGTVERHYWKRLVESSCGWGPGWRQLASLSNKPLLNSQLDYVPQDWVRDANDWAQIFANIVSPEISSRFEKIMETLIDNDGYQVCAGPPKTLARCLAKCREYMSEFQLEQSAPRWANFAENFKTKFQRAPSKPDDFIWNVVDFARCAITVPTAGDILKVKRQIEDQFPVICIKNSYNSEIAVKGSGYRDMKLLVEVEYENLQLGGVPKVQSKTTLVCEVQILCQAWLVNKKTTSISYKILRAQSLRSLFSDTAKYVRMTVDDGIPEKLYDATDIIKNGWVNLAKAADFASIDADKLLLTAAKESWSAEGVRMLVQDLNANKEVVDVDGYTPLILASKTGADNIIKCLIKLGSNTDHRDHFNGTALSWAADNGNEEVVRILLSAGAAVSVKDRAGMSALDYALKNFLKESTLSRKRIVRLLRGETVFTLSGTDKKHSKFDELKEAAIEGSLAEFLDIQDVPESCISELLATQAAVSSLENLLQTLWFGGNIEQRYLNWTPLLFAAKSGTPATVRVLLNAGAEVNVKDSEGSTPLLAASRYGIDQVVKLLLDSKADVNAKTNAGWSSILYAARWGNQIMVNELLKFGANVHDKVEQFDVYQMAHYNMVDRLNVVNLLAEHLEELHE